MICKLFAIYKAKRENYSADQLVGSATSVKNNLSSIMLKSFICYLLESNRLLINSITAESLSIAEWLSPPNTVTSSPGLDRNKHSFA